MILAIDWYYLRLHLSSAATCSDVTDVPLLHFALVTLHAISDNHDQNG